METSKFYQFSAKSLQGNVIAMNEFRNKVVLIVNTASKCGFTPQYEGLEKLHRQYADKGLAILGFPCNQFGQQEPGTEKEISEGCLINYGVSFRMFAKVDVNGEAEHPLFTFLKNEKKSLLGKRIKWNFTKFLVDRDGKVIHRFAPTTTPEKIEKYIQKLVN